jgi:hypothetical protein
MPVKIRFLLETKVLAVAEAIRWISPRQVDLTHWNDGVKRRFASFLQFTQRTYAFLEGARCVQEFERYDGTEFWKVVKNEQQSTASKVVHITISVSSFAYDRSGIKYFKAECMGEGRWQLTGREALDNDNGFFTAVYWLPYKAGATEFESRATYENNPSVDFFMTFELSGCRFAMDDTHVYHVAYDAGSGGSSSRANSGSRDASMNAAMRTAQTASGLAPGRVRSLSINGDDEVSFSYGLDGDSKRCRAVVIGARGAANRGNEQWAYKAFLFDRDSVHSTYKGRSTWCVVLDKTRFADKKLWDD